VSFCFFFFKYKILDLVVGLLFFNCKSWNQEQEKKEEEIIFLFKWGGERIYAIAVALCFFSFLLFIPVYSTFIFIPELFFPLPFLQKGFFSAIKNRAKKATKRRPYHWMGVCCWIH
jgi:hypothetical protein